MDGSNGWFGVTRCGPVAERKKRVERERKKVAEKEEPPVYIGFAVRAASESVISLLCPVE